MTEQKPLKRIYLTHCSKDKDPEYYVSGQKTTPDLLYTSPSLQQFIKYCNEHHHYWAIFSDRYGVVCRDERINWYNKPPDKVTEEEFMMLCKNFVERLAWADEIYFYHRAGETHPLFSRVVAYAIEKGMVVKEFTVESMAKGE